MTLLIDAVASDSVLETALCWLRKRRQKYSHNDDVWTLLFRWDELKPVLQSALLMGRYRFSPLRRIHRNDGDDLDVWSAMDSLVLKALAIVLTEQIGSRLSARCFHLAGRGGAKGAVREVVASLPRNQFVFRTDVKSYYASIHHDVLMAQVRRFVKDPRVLELLRQIMERSICDDGLYQTVQQGISLGCPLSPLMGAIFLDILDQRMQATGLTYVRFMDDWVILAPTRWRLRKAIRIVCETLAELQVGQHPEKTFIGRISRGFDFLGYHISTDSFGPAEKTVTRFVERVNQLYEQGADTVRIRDYVRRWNTWVIAGLDVLALCPSVDGLFRVADDHEAFFKIACPQH